MSGNRLLVRGGGVAAILSSFVFLSFQVDLGFPWELLISGILILWLAGFTGLFIQARANRLGRIGLGLSMAGTALLALAFQLPETIGELIFYAFYLVPGGLILYGLTAARNRALGWASGVPLALGIVFSIFLNPNPAWSPWVERTFSTLIGLGWLLLGFRSIQAGSTRQTAALTASGGSAPGKQPGRRLGLLFGLLLLPYLAATGLIWRHQNQMLTCPPEFPLQVPASSPRPVIVDLDMAHEDMHALLYLLKHPGVEVLAITVAGTGEAHCEPGVRHALGLAALSGNPDIPVACGPETPYPGGHAFPARWRADVDSLYGLELDPNPNRPSDLSAPELIYKTILESPSEVTILAVGPVTNIALALEADPALAENLAGIFMMGGAVEIGGNVGFSGVGIKNPVAEWNIYADPRAANHVFQSGVPVTLVPLNATRHAVITPSFYHCLQGNHRTPEATFVYRLLGANFNFVQSGGFQFWDSLTAAIFTDETLASFEMRDLIVVEAEGLSSGQTRPSSEGFPVRVATWADGDRFEALFLNTLNGDHGPEGGS